MLVHETCCGQTYHRQTLADRPQANPRPRRQGPIARCLIVPRMMHAPVRTDGKKFIHIRDGRDKRRSTDETSSVKSVVHGPMIAIAAAMPQYTVEIQSPELDNVRSLNHNRGNGTGELTRTDLLPPDPCIADVIIRIMHVALIRSDPQNVNATRHIRYYRERTDGFLITDDFIFESIPFVPMPMMQVIAQPNVKKLHYIETEDYFDRRGFDTDSKMIRSDHSEIVPLIVKLYRSSYPLRLARQAPCEQDIQRLRYFREHAAIRLSSRLRR